MIPPAVKRFFSSKSMTSFHRPYFPLWNHLLKQRGSVGRIITGGTPYWTTAAKFGQRGEISSPQDTGISLLGLSKTHNPTRALKGQAHTLPRTYPNTRARRPCPEGLESHQYHRSPPVALEPGMACHLELGGGFVRGVLKPSGTCFDRVPDHLARHTVYQ